jgi:hypothetical protein
MRGPYLNFVKNSLTLVTTSHWHISLTSSTPRYRLIRTVRNENHPDPYDLNKTDRVDEALQDVTIARSSTRLDVANYVLNDSKLKSLITLLDLAWVFQHRDLLSLLNKWVNLENGMSKPSSVGPWVSNMLPTC